MAGVADTLRVDAGREGQLVHRAGFTEGAPTVLADVLECRKRTEQSKRAPGLGISTQGSANTELKKGRSCYGGGKSKPLNREPSPHQHLTKFC